MMSQEGENPPTPGTLLEKIQSPKDVKALEEKELLKLAEEIRERLIASLANTGGHLGPNLGVVELTIAMHRVFSTPEDKFLFDVSHQGYVHKMLTGRAAEIKSIRQFEGLCGFLLRAESPHDSYGAGHAGTAVSAALGMAAARDLKGGDNHVVAVAGDAAFTSGPTFEALNNIASSTKRLIIVLNDNEWSIDRNVGAIAKYFNQITTSGAYSAVHQKAAEFVEKIGGKPLRRFAHKVEESAKHLLLDSVIFEEFGLRYYGPIDGHDVVTLVKTFEFLKTQNQPVLLHIITEKGRGYEPALKKPQKFHGLGQYEVKTGETAPGKSPTYSEIFGKTLTTFAKEDENVVAITAAMPGGTGLVAFQNALPGRFFDVGIAEEHAALFSCGLAAEGLKPFLAIYSTFMQRAFDMIVHDMTLQNLPVRLCMDRAGLSAEDGPTHHGLFDIGYLRHIPNIILMQPKDEEEFVDMLWTMKNYDQGPTAIRYPRGMGNGTVPKKIPVPLKIGEAELVQDGEDIAILALGAFFDLGKEVCEALTTQGISCALVNPRWIKPLDETLILSLAKKVKLICTIEDHVIENGFGSGVLSLLNQHNISLPIERIGWQDEFIEHGNLSLLREKHGFTVDTIVQKIKKHL